MKKKIIKKITSILILILILTGCSSNNDELVMVTEAGFAPYEYYENEEIIGIDIDIAEEIAKELGKKLVVKDVAFDSIINEVKSGKADFGAAGISYSEERAKQVDFSNDYATSRQIVIVKKNSKIKTISNISDKKIAVQLGSIADTYVTKNYTQATIIRQKKNLAMIQDLKDNKADCVVMDEIPAKEILNNNEGLEILSGELTSDSYGIVVKKGNDELLEVINKVIKRMQEDGSIEESILKHSNK